MKRIGKVLILAYTFAFMALLGGCGAKGPKYLATTANVEAGNTFRATDFLLEQGHTAEFTGDFKDKYVENSVAKVNTPGDYKLTLLVDGKDVEVLIKVRDTQPPEAEGQDLTIIMGQTVQASQCVKNVSDAGNVTVEFVGEVDFSNYGVISPTVRLTDEAGNERTISVKISIRKPEDAVGSAFVIEAGSPMPTMDDIVGPGCMGTILTDTSVINTSLIGTHKLEIEIFGHTYHTQMLILDTIAPVASITPQKMYAGTDYPEASEFVSDIVDAGPVTVTYEKAPSGAQGDREAVRIVLTDQGGNTTVYDSYFEYLVDDEAPAFTAFPEKLHVDVGDSIIWRAYVEANDNSGVVDLSLDTSKAKLKVPGSYECYFVAKDRAGNETRQPFTLLVHDNAVTKEMMDALIESIFAKILTDGMTVQEQVYAIFRYVRDNMKYIRDGVSDDMRREAYIALTSRKKGDCFTFCAASHEMFDYLGIESIMVKRRADLTSIAGNHYWLLVNIGTKEDPKWYHHDSSPHAEPYDQETYLMTNAQAAAYTNFREANGKIHYYTFDPSLYPEVSTETLYDLGVDAKYYD